MTERGGTEVPQSADTSAGTTSEQGPDVDLDMAPGGPRAVARGCVCSVLANAAFRARADVDPFFDPRCPVHAGGTA